MLGEGSFLHLLGFLHAHAPDRCTAEVMRLAAQDEARHVAFGMAHLQRQARADATLLGGCSSRSNAATTRCGTRLGLNEEVFDALVLLAAGEFTPGAIARGHTTVTELVQQMDAGRRARLKKLGFDGERAAALSALHMRNFM